MADRDLRSEAEASERQAIPMPTIHPATYEWRKRSWPTSAEVWPPLQPWFPRLRTTTNLLFFGALFVAVVVVFGLLFEMPSATEDVDVWKRPLVLLAVIETCLATLAMLLRRLGVVEGLSRLTFLIFSVSTVGGLAIIGSVLFSAPQSVGEGGDWLPAFGNVQTFFIALSFVVLAIVTWMLMSGEVRSHRESRDSIAAARRGVVSGDQWPRVTGTPGATLLSNGRGGDGNLLRRTAIAEQLTAPLLNELLIIPSTAIVHRLRFPNSETAHIGHAAVAGGLVALIDSVLWEPGDYRLDKWGRIIRNGSVSEDNTVNLPIAVERFAAAFSAPIRGWVVVHGLSAGNLTAINDDDDALVRIATPDALLQEVGDWLSTEGTVMNVFALRFALSRHIP